MDCPACRAPIEFDPRFVAWCRQCEWNVDPTPEPLARRRYSRWRRQRDDAAARRVLDGFVTRRADRIGWTFRAIAWTGAALVHLLTVIFVALALWVLVGTPIPLGFRIVAALVLLGLAWLARPRIGRMPNGGLSRGTAPHLFKLLDQVADVVGARPPARVFVTGEANASFARVGLRRQHVLCLGLPLWTVLGPQGRIALLGHELGHDANGDCRNGIWMGSAIHALGEWHQLTRAPGGGDALANYVVPIALAPLGIVTWVGRRFLYRVTLRHGQCAEYRADLFALRAGGTVGALDGVDTMLLAPAYLFGMRRLTTGSTTEPTARLAEYAQSIPASERDRIRRAASIQLSRIDGTHPPTWLRYQLIERTPPTEPAITASATDLGAITAELHQTSARAATSKRAPRRPYRSQ
jgi:Zn-dependent protease with chaperone function